MSPLKDFPPLTDVSTPLELKHGDVVYFKAEKDSHTKFYFDVNEPLVIKIDVWPLNAKSDPDLYIKIDDENVNEKNSDFKRNNYGNNLIIIPPDHLKFKIGRYWALVHAF